MSNSLITKNAIAASLKELMKSSDLHKISVKDIVDKCGVNRQTFYYHFQDIFDLIDWIYKTEAVESISEYRSYETWTDGLFKIFKYIEENKSFCLNTLNSMGRNHLDMYLYSVTNELIMGVVNEVALNRNVANKDKEFLANFYTLAFTGLVIQCMKNGMLEKPNSIIEDLKELIHGNFVVAIDRYEKKGII
ncbi:TetR/AcrR family transcriptional regulator [Clostridium carnis]